MKKHLFIICLFITLFFYGQEKKYSDIDSLLTKNSTIDALTALKKLKENHVKDSINSGYWLRFSKASYTTYNYDNAKSSINKAIKISPNNAEYYFEKGLLHNRIGELKPALLALDKAVKTEAKGEYLYWRGIVNQQLNNIETAQNDYQKAIENNFESPELYVNYAILLSQNHEYKKSLEIINKAIKIDNMHSHAISTRANIQLFLLKIDAACDDSKTALKLGYTQVIRIPDAICNGTDNKKALFLAEVLVSNKHYKQAIIAYIRLINFDSLNSRHFLNRGYSYYQLKDFEKAEKDYLKGLTLEHPEFDKFYDNLSLLYFDQNNYKKAIEYSTKRIELNSKNHVAYLDRGLSYRKMKKYKEAEKDFETSLKIMPKFFRAFGYRSYLYLEQGKYQEALKDAERAVEINPKYAYGYLVLAQSKQALNLPDFCNDYFAAKKYGWGNEADFAIKRFCK
ncbi:MAG TPA: hypothetical protein DDZ39_04050 [Flavobacteriaceae bacterium]|jgi:tetratricopeptide (TPR) repeat protein|nr:hypothetical protein [Flavobacteriaceae bacterium]HBS11577.1 hypothetical protein [Flavobacteriaceae bacterium]